MNVCRSANKCNIHVTQQPFNGRFANLPRQPLSQQGQACVAVVPEMRDYIDVTEMFCENLEMLTHH